MDKSRQKFEETIKSLSDPSEFESKLKRANNDPSEFESKLKRANNGLNYADREIDLMWISWQASRENLINSLEPVGYAAEIDINEIEIYGQLFLNEDPTEETNIPLYRLDK